MPIAARRLEIIERVAANLHIVPDDVWVGSAVDSAIEYATARTGQLELEDTELTVNGLVGFSTRLYMDGFSPNGAQVSVGDSSFEPIFQPEHLWMHWRHYFEIYQASWGRRVNIDDITKRIGDGLVEAGYTKIPVVAPGTPIAVLPCVALVPGDDGLENGNRTLRYGLDITAMVPRSSQPEQYALLTELQAIILQALTLSNVRFGDAFFFRLMGGEGTGEPPAQARIIPVSFIADVDLCP